MPILDIQVRARELGRIRIGQVVRSSNGKTRPEKIDRFRFTGYSRDLLTQVAGLYGGEVVDWSPQGGGAAGFEVVTDAKRVPILVPPQPVSQWMELWSGGGCQRRCDGVTEQLSDQPCLCGPDPEQRECKPTTRLNVMLRDVPGLGVWRMESHGYYAAAELPAVAEFLSSTRGYIPAALILEERVVKRDGKTRRFMVPGIEVEQITPAQLMAGGSDVGFQPGQITAPAPAALPAAGQPSWGELINGASTRDELLAIRDEAKRSGADPALIDHLLARRAQQIGAPRTVDAAPRTSTADPNALWTQILAAAPEGWTTADVELEFERTTGVAAEKATAADMERYLNGVTA